MNDTLVRLDLNDEKFQAQFVELDPAEGRVLFKAMRKIMKLTWSQVYADQGLKWERIANSNDRYNIRLNQQARTVVTRQGNFMRFESLHYDHDSAYDR
jgi:GH35 family endo-1,4-beta-xylanase